MTIAPLFFRTTEDGRNLVSALVVFLLLEGKKRKEKFLIGRRNPTHLRVATEAEEALRLSLSLSLPDEDCHLAHRRCSRLFSRETKG